MWSGHNTSNSNITHYTVIISLDTGQPTTPVNTNGILNSRKTLHKVFKACMRIV
jgi:hypothetical protein